MGGGGAGGGGVGSELGSEAGGCEEPDPGSEAGGVELPPPPELGGEVDPPPATGPDGGGGVDPPPEPGLVGGGKVDPPSATGLEGGVGVELAPSSETGWGSVSETAGPRTMSVLAWVLFSRFCSGAAASTVAKIWYAPNRPKFGTGNVLTEVMLARGGSVPSRTVANR